jgi:hypothetical protein
MPTIITTKAVLVTRQLAVKWRDHSWAAPILIRSRVVSSRAQLGCAKRSRVLSHRAYLIRPRLSLTESKLPRTRNHGLSPFVIPANLRSGNFKSPRG